MFAENPDAMARAPTYVPRAEHFFEPVRERIGWRLAWVFGNQAQGGLCPYYKVNLCRHCDIGAGEGAQFNLDMNRKRLAWFLATYAWILPELSHLVVYNSGSVLNSAELSPQFLVELLNAGPMPRLHNVSCDSRESFIRDETLYRFLACLPLGRVLRPIVGLETSDDHIRNELLTKRMSRTAFERALATIATVSAKVGPGRVGLDVNILVGGPGAPHGRAVEDAARTASYVLTLGLDVAIDVNLNLHGYYPSTRGRAWFPDHPRCSPEVLAAAGQAIVEVARSIGSEAEFFIGWQDEGHDTEPDRRVAELATTRQVFALFNETQDPRSLAPLLDKQIH